MATRLSLGLSRGRRPASTQVSQEFTSPGKGFMTIPASPRELRPAPSSRLRLESRIANWLPFDGHPYFVLQSGRRSKC
jgi:hypothetical protein